MHFNTDEMIIKMKYFVPLVLWVALGCSRQPINLQGCYFYFDAADCDVIRNYSDCYTNFVELCFKDSLYSTYLSIRGRKLEYPMHIESDVVELNGVKFSIKKLSNNGRLILSNNQDTLVLTNVDDGYGEPISNLFEKKVPFEELTKMIRKRINEALYVAHGITQDEIDNYLDESDTLSIDFDLEIKPAQKQQSL